jgi:hypothetical protein
MGKRHSSQESMRCLKIHWILACDGSHWCILPAASSVSHRSQLSVNHAPKLSPTISEHAKPPKPNSPGGGGGGDPVYEVQAGIIISGDS